MVFYSAISKSKNARHKNDTEPRVDHPEERPLLQKGDLLIVLRNDSVFSYGIYHRYAVDSCDRS